MFHMQGGEHEVILFAITIDPRQPISMSLSPQGEHAAKTATALILDELVAHAAPALAGAD